MRHIGMVLDNPYTGDNRVINEARALQNGGNEVYVLALNFGQHSPIEDMDGVRIRRIPIPQKLKNYLFAFQLRLPFYDRFWEKEILAFIDDFEIEVIHAHDLYMVPACASAAHKKKLPLVIDLHENYPAAVKNYRWTQKFPGSLISRARHWKDLEGELLQQADGIVVLSEFYQKQLCSEYPALNDKKFAVYPNVPDHETLLKFPVKPNPLPHPESKWLFYFGVIAERRGVYTAIDSVKLLREQGHDVRLLLAGNVNNAEQEEFQRRISDPPVAEFVLHKSWIDISEFPTYANACTAGLSPIFSGAQHDIGVANKVFQYMLFELPVIASDSVAQAEVVKENGCGMVFKSGDVSGMAAALLTIISDGNLAAEMGKNGKNAVMTKYNLQVFGGSLRQLYQQLES